MSFPPAETVLLTGASGYIAVHILAQLFTQGYNVIGTVRSTSKGDFLAKKFPGFKYEIVDNLTNDNAFDSVFKLYPEIKYVLHAASPVFPKDNSTDFVQSYVTPAIEGTLSALKGAVKYGPNVEKFVYTSSVAAAYPGDVTKKSSAVFVSEKTWNPITLADVEANPSWGTGYPASKTYAERALWKFYETEKPKFAVAAMIVPIVSGPPIHDVTYESPGSTAILLKNVLELPKDTKTVPQSDVSHVDVRDVARAHIKTLFSTRTDGHRIFIFGGRLTVQLVLDILHKYRPEASAHLPVGTPGEIDDSAFYKYDNSESRRLLGFETISPTKTVLDLFDSLALLKKSAK